MKFEYANSCALECPYFADCKDRVLNAGKLELQAYADGGLIDEGEFKCGGPLQVLTGEGPFCQGEIIRLPHLSNGELTQAVETILGPIAVNALAAEDDID